MDAGSLNGRFSRWEKIDRTRSPLTPKPSRAVTAWRKALMRTGRNSSVRLVHMCSSFGSRGGVASIQIDEHVAENRQQRAILP
jgi:hypothetical protein